MRTVSFTQFDGERWRNRWDGRGRQGSDPQVIQPAKQPPSVAGSTIVAQSNQPWFAFEKGDSDQQFDHFEVMLPFGRGALVPVPIGSHWIQCDLNSRTSVMLLDVHGNIWPGSINNQRYRLLVSKTSKLSEPSARKPSDTYVASLLSIPESERSWIEQAKSRVFRSGISFEQRCQDVEQFFIREFDMPRKMTLSGCVANGLSCRHSWKTEKPHTVNTLLQRLYCCCEVKRSRQDSVPATWFMNMTMTKRTLPQENETHTLGPKRMTQLPIDGKSSNPLLVQTNTSNVFPHLIRELLIKRIKPTVTTS